MYKKVFLTAIILISLYAQAYGQEIALPEQNKKVPVNQVPENQDGRFLDTNPEYLFQDNTDKIQVNKSESRITDTKQAEMTEIKFDSPAENGIGSVIQLKQKQTIGIKKTDTPDSLSLPYIELHVGGRLNSYLHYKISGRYYNLDNPDKNRIATGTYVSSGGIEVGSGFYKDLNESNDPTTYALYGKYKLKKYAIKGEYTTKKNVNNSSNYSYSEGWFLSNSYYLTDTIKVIAQSSRLNAEEGMKNNIILEYAIKHSKFLKLNDLKLQLDASRVTDVNKENHNRFGMKAKFSL